MGVAFRSSRNDSLKDLGWEKLVTDIPQVDDYFLLCIAQADRRKPLS
jgi:hypothetical protein